MPGMDGWETLEAIRENPRTADIPVIMCTVKGSAIDILRALQLGCDGYVGKPFDIDQLVDEVRCVAARPPSEREAYRSRRLAEVREIVKDDSGAK
jgi:CheY-like chemotaxis protein